MPAVASAVGAAAVIAAAVIAAAAVAAAAVAIMVESAAELTDDDLDGAERVALAAGASTPEDVIEEIRNRLGEVLRADEDEEGKD